MNLRSLRKIIITSRFGLTLLFGLTFFGAMFFVTGFRQPISLVIDAVFGILFGVLMSSKFRNNNKYFIKNIEQNQYDLAKNTTSYLKQSGFQRGKKNKSNTGGILIG